MSTETTSSNDGGDSSCSGSLLRQTLMNVDECFLYKLPPLTTSGGHRAEQWDLANPLQTCGFQVERRNNDLYLLFTTENHTKLFALTKLSDNASKNIESVVDSSRYFVTQIQANTTNNGRSAYVGFGFRDRDVALDLIGNLQQFQKSIQREQQAKNMKVAEIPKLAEGEKMHISLGKNTERKAKSTSTTKSSSTTTTTTGGPILLKKPPKVAISPSGTKNTIEATATAIVDLDPEQLHLNLENINLQDEHHSVASSASDEAHAANDATEEEEDEEEWDDFQQA